MHGKRWPGRKIYPTYNPYPISWDSEANLYTTGEESVSESPAKNKSGRPDTEEFSLITDPTPFGDWTPSESIASNDEQGFRPLKVLNSLFADRLNLLQRALDELQESQRDREHLTRNAMEELDLDIRKCDHSLSLALLIDPNEKERLQRRLLDLKRERRREKLLNWRDLVWLRREIRKLQSDISSFERPAESYSKKEAPG